NARDAMPDGGSITVGAKTVCGLPGGDPEAALVCLTVTDTGDGMDSETPQQATTPFFTTKGVGKGTGLGLSMVQGLAEQSGGRLQIESHKGEGTTISLILPIAEGSLQPSCPGNDQPEMQIAPAHPPPSLTVLAVDDDALVLMNTT